MSANTGNDMTNGRVLFAVRERFCRDEILRLDPMNLFKAALKRPHSRRFARFEAMAETRQRLDCECFSTDFGPGFT
ncbi:MAG TPA: hypothetical protein VFF11_15185, partial [Candidatus Binatia bacterium]|nr:hypothetical protein [Candidatus Binatia bacterium]